MKEKYDQESQNKKFENEADEASIYKKNNYKQLPTDNNVKLRKESPKSDRSL